MLFTAKVALLRSLLGCCALLPSIGAVQAQSRLEAPSAAELIEALQAPMPAAPVAGTTRSLRPGARAPDPATSLCVAAGNVLPAAAPGAAARNLYVSDAPKVDLDVRFGLDSSRLTAQGRQLLDAVAEALASARLGASRFVVAGHTDRRGADDYNKRLSCERALSVRDYLLAQHGIAASRLIALGFGFDKPIDSADPGADVNRRVELRKFSMPPSTEGNP